MTFAQKLFQHLMRSGYLKIKDREIVRGLSFKYNIEYHHPDGTVKKVDICNLLTNQGLQYLGGGTAFEGNPQYNDFYIFLYTNGRVPLESDTPANLPEYGELTTGIDLTSRPRWNWTKSGFVYDSSAAPAEWKVTASSVTVRGIGIVTMSAFGSTGGLLISASMQDSPETVKTPGFIRTPATIEFSRG
jgi:hypothetical protein